MKKAQTAIEFLTTYGWAIIGIILMLMVLLYYGAFNPLRFVPRQCTFEPGLPCTSHKLEVDSTTGNTILITQLSNNFGYDIALPENAALLHAENIGKSGKNTYVGNCSPMLPYIIKKGALFTCIVNITDREVIPSIGNNIKLNLELNYKNCLTDPDYLTTGNCTAASNYTSVGTIVTPVEGFSPTLYCGDGICSSSIGENPSTCPRDCPPPTTLLLTASPKLVAPDGVQFSVITAQLLNSTGSPMSNLEVTFISTPIGELSSYSNVTNSSGETTVLITSARNGVAKVTAFAGISNQTDVTFQIVPTTLLIGAYDQYLGYCGGGSYIIAEARDSANRPVGDVTVQFSSNASGTSTLFPPYETSDENGFAISYFQDNKIEKVRVNASLDIDELGVHLTNSTVVQVVDCQGCNAPVMGDWIIDKNVLCEDANITLNGNLNISIEIGYVKRWGNLTFRNVTLNLASSFNGQRGIYMNKKSKFLVTDKDNNPVTTEDRSSIVSPSWSYIFWVKPNAEQLEITNSYLYGCGYNISPNENYQLYNQIDYRGGLFVSINKMVFENNTISSSRLAGIILNSSSSSIIRGNVFDDARTAILLINSTNTTITDNSITTGSNNGNVYSGTDNPSIWLNDSKNNTISENYIYCNSVETDWAGPAIQLSRASHDNQIINNYMEKCHGEVTLDWGPRRNTFYNNKIYDAHGAALVMHGVYDNVFENNEIINLGSGIHYNPSGIFMTESDNNVFRNTTVQISGGTCDSPWYGVELEMIGSSNNTFSDTTLCGWCGRIAIGYSSKNNTLTRLNLDQTRCMGFGYPITPVYAISIANSPNTMIINSKQISSIFLNASDGSQIVNNTILGSSTYGIQLINSKTDILNNTIIKASCTDLYGYPSSTRYGIYSNNSEVTILYNNIQYFNESGVYIDNRDNPLKTGTVKNNSISSICPFAGAPTLSLCGDWGDGLCLIGAEKVAIDGNNITSINRNGAVGILFMASNSSVTSNNIKNNYYGVWCRDPPYPTSLLDNLFSGNTNNYGNCPVAAFQPISMCGTIYVNSNLTTDLVNDSTCITFGADNIVLDCDGHSITRVGGSGDAYGIYADGKKNITIKNCVVKNYTNAIYLIGTSNSTILNNTLFPGVFGIFLNLSDYITIYNNTVYDGVGGITIDYSNHNNISYNHLLGNSMGITLGDSSYNLISNNSYYPVGYLVLFVTGNGITIHTTNPLNCEGNNVSNNTIYGIGGTGDASYYINGGIYVVECNNTIIENNDIAYISGYGINSHSNYSYIYNNKIHNELAPVYSEGITIGGNNSKIYYNNIFETDTGIYCTVTDTDFLGNIVIAPSTCTGCPPTCPG